MTKRPRRRANREPVALGDWELIENAVAAVKCAIGQTGSWKVTRNAMVRERVSREKRQVDVFLECPSGPTTFRAAIEVKHERRPLTIEAMEQLCAKAGKLEIDRFTVVSTSGFTKAAEKAAQSAGIYACTIEKLSASTFFGSTAIVAPQIQLLKTEVLFEAGTDTPEPECLEEAWVEDQLLCRPMKDLVADLAASFASQAGLREGEPIRFVSAPEGGSLTSMRACDRTWKAPDSFVITFSVQYESRLGVLLRMEDGREAFTVVTPLGGRLRQLTLIQNELPSASLGTTISVHVSELRPPPREV